MKKLLFFCCLVACLIASAQSNDTTKYTPVNGYGYNYKRLKIDSSLMLALGDTTSKAPRQIKFVGNNIFYSDNTGVWHPMASGGGGGGTGVSNIYTRNDSLFYALGGAEYFVNAYFSKDSADARYYSITNPAGYLTNAAIAGKVNYTDTALMLNPYLHKADTSNMLAPYLKTTVGDTRYPLLSGSYSNPSWLGSLAWNKLTGTPSTLGGYGITDGYSSTNPAGYITNSTLAGYVPSSTTLTINGTAYDLSGNRSWTVSGGLPSQTGNAGRYLTTDGTSASWGVVSTSGDVPHYYGTIYNKNSWSDLSDFVVNNMTAVVSGNKIGITSSTGLSTLDYNYYSELDHWSNVVKIKATSTSAIFGVGTHSYNTYQGFSVYAKFNCGTGVLSIINGNTVPSYAETTLATATSTLTVATNDYILISLERDVDTVFATVRDITSGSNLVKVSYGYQINSTTNSSPNTGMYAVYAGGGSFTVDSMAVTSNEIVNSNLLITTDSKGEYVANDFKSRWTQQVSNLYYPTVLSVGGTERVEELLNRIPEIIALNPKAVLLLLGRNDISQGNNLDSTKNRYKRAVGYLQSAGITVYHLDDIYEIDNDLTALSYWKDTSFPGYVINTFAPTKQVGSPFLYSDGAHQVQAGHDFVAKIVIQSGLLNKGLNYNNLVRLNATPYPIALNNFNSNQFIGNSGNGSTTGIGNIGLGTGAIAALSTGASNIGIGIHAGNAALTDNYSIYLGNYAAPQNSGGKYNIFIGDHAGVNALDAATHAEASRNIMIGAWGGPNTNTLGKDNVYIGNYAGQFYAPSAGTSNTLMISGGSSSGTGGSGFGTSGYAFDGHDLIFGNFNTGQLRVGLDASSTCFECAVYPLITGITLDVNGGLLLPPRHNGVSGLATTTDGGIYYDTTAHSLAFWNGKEWHNIVPQHSIVTLTEGGNPSFFGNNIFYILNASGNLSAITATLGKTVFQDNNVLTLIPKVNVATVTWNSFNGSSVGGSNCVNCPTSFMANQRITLIYDKATDSWY